MTGTWHKSERCEERDPGENSERQVGVKREVTKIHGVGGKCQREMYTEKETLVIECGKTTQKRWK